MREVVTMTNEHGETMRIRRPEARHRRVRELVAVLDELPPGERERAVADIAFELARERDGHDATERHLRHREQQLEGEIRRLRDGVQRIAQDIEEDDLCDLGWSDELRDLVGGDDAWLMQETPAQGASDG